jgi:group I intron endonuclease
MSTGNIYLIINKQNGHKYVGQTTQTINKRWAQHIGEARRMSDKPLHRAIRKYGTHMFMIRELCECSVDELDEKEKHYINLYDTFNDPQHYNARDGGDSPILSEETKQKISESKSKLVNTKEHNKNISSSLKQLTKDKPWGFHLAENRGSGITSRCKMRGVNIETGEEKIWDSASDAAKEVTGNSKYNHNILQAADKGYKSYGYRWQRLGPKSNKKPVYGINKITWEKTTVYESMREAGRQYGNDNGGSGLLKSLKNPNKYSWKGYYWFYVTY